MILVPGIIYYWVSWILWTIVTFLKAKSKLRTHLACLILIAIIFSKQTIVISHVHVSISYVVLFTISLLLLTKIPQLLYYLFISSLMIGCYVVILSVELYEPVWIVFPRILMISLACFWVNILFIKHFQSQLIVTVFAMCVGEFLFIKLFLPSYATKFIGNLLFFDQLLLTIISLYFTYLGWNGLKILSKKIKEKRSSSQKQLKIPS